jgi:hypothetical protein
MSMLRLLGAHLEGPLKTFSRYMALMSNILDFEPSSFLGGNKPIGMAGCHCGEVHLHHEE